MHWTGNKVTLTLFSDSLCALHFATLNCTALHCSSKYMSVCYLYRKLAPKPTALLWGTKWHALLSVFKLPTPRKTFCRSPKSAGETPLSQLISIVLGYKMNGWFYSLVVFLLKCFQVTCDIFQQYWLSREASCYLWSRETYISQHLQALIRCHFLMKPTARISSFNVLSRKAP